MGWQEVTQDQFQGSLRYPLFNKDRRQGTPDQAEAHGVFPAGIRTVWMGKGFEWEAVAVETPEGRRFWLSDKIEVLTLAEADARWRKGLDDAAAKVLAEDRAREQAAARAAGLTVEAWKDRKKLRAEQKRFDAHRRSKEQFERDILAGRIIGSSEYGQPMHHLSNKDA
jgi:hypothetical protein